MAAVPVAVPVGVPVAPQMQNPYAVLDSLPAVFIKQQISLTEVLTGCEMKNKYKVYAANPETMEKIPERDALFRCIESSSCFQRQCCGPHREFTLETFMRHPTNPEEGKGPLLTTSFRPFKCCEFLCFNRPEMFVKGADGRQIGHVYAPFTCCTFDVDIGQASSKRLDQGEINKDAMAATPSNWPYKVTATCCQPGVWCQCPCGDCKRIVFEVKDATGQLVGEVQKVFAGCCKEAMEVSNFAVRFPAGSTWFQKASFINAVVLMDFLWFEEKQNNNGGGGGGF